MAEWIFGLKLPSVTEPASFTRYSSTWVSIFLYFLMVFICLKRNLSFFIKVLSYGAVSIVVISFYVISMGLYSMSNTNYELVWFPKESDKVYDFAQLDTNMRKLMMFNTNFTPLAGMLGIGYFLHPVSIPIMRGNRI